ncbi:hypothetical protein [Echinicola arenosa]|nr:hypothetical protein [Echinicola arenosa]
MKKQFSLLMLGLLFSCNQGEEQPLANPTQINQYFPLKDFVSDQIGRVSDMSVEKLTDINGEEESFEVKLDAEGWRKELDIFIQSDINKAANASAYHTEEKGLVLRHELKQGLKGEVKHIQVEYASREKEEVQKIEFKSEKDNFFYHSLSEGVLEVDAETGLLKSYHVKGYQKVWFLDPNQIEISGKLKR